MSVQNVLLFCARTCLFSLSRKGHEHRHVVACTTSLKQALEGRSENEAAQLNYIASILRMVVRLAEYQVKLGEYQKTMDSDSVDLRMLVKMESTRKAIGGEDAKCSEASKTLLGDLLEAGAHQELDDAVHIEHRRGSGSLAGKGRVTGPHTLQIDISKLQVLSCGRV